jgi:DNA polymerase III delta prime subunit
MAKIKQLWVKKHAPKSLAAVVFQNTAQQAKFTRYLKEGEFPHLLLSGVQGSGKSSISNALIQDFKIDDMDVLTINASKENSVDTMRNKISNFVQTFASGPFKVVQLEEMDGLSAQAQGALRVIMEEYSDYVRFIGTCNYANKIIPALKSRMTHYEFKAPSFEDTAVLVANILVNEGVDFEVELLEKYIAASYPDIRSLINSLQENSEDGKLTEPQIANSNDYKFQVLDLLEAGKIRDIRKIICENVTREDYEDVYRFMYENIHKCKGFDADQHEAAIVLIADYLYKHSLVADPEINFAALCIRLYGLQE